MRIPPPSPHAPHTAGSRRTDRARTAAVVLAALVAWSCQRREEFRHYVEPEPGILLEGTGRKSLDAQSRAERERLDAGCVSCHEGIRDPHLAHRHEAPGGDEIPPASATELTGGRYNANIACVDCHGGNPGATTKEEAHPSAAGARFLDSWAAGGGANPERSYTELLVESREWIRFVNPGDLRVANRTCGPCHPDHVLNVRKSLMATSAHFWAAAGYCNGIVPLKKSIFGESYNGLYGLPQRVNSVWQYEEERALDLERGVTPFVLPLPHWEVTQPGNVFRVFEKGSRLGHVALGLNGLPTPIVGLPDKLEDPGRPNNRLSDRGLGTLNRIDLPLLNLSKTRLNNPHLAMLGTNDHPGDYRSSGCTACHVVYANDRSPVHSGERYARFGRDGAHFGEDSEIPSGVSGHPIAHQFTTAIPSSQCLTCHHHQPNSFLNTYFGFTMWSYETDGEGLWPDEEKDPSHEEYVETLERNPEGAAVRGSWGDRDVLRKVATAENPSLEQTQFADYHGHGWIFRAVFKMDRKGNYLDAEGNRLDFDDPDKFRGVVPLELGPEAEVAQEDRGHFDADEATDGRAVHLKDIHAERGMHCVDCHWSQDVHGYGKLQSEYQGAIEIQCEDCHGTIREEAALLTSGPASYTRTAEGYPRTMRPFGSFLDLRTPFGEARFFRDGQDRIVQRSMLDPDREWVVPQVKDSVDPGHERYNPAAAWAKTVQRDNRSWGEVPSSGEEEVEVLAHSRHNMSCHSCHTSWVTSCFGCHLPQEANMKTPMRNFEHKDLRNFASYNPQVVRDDAFMLAVEPDVQRSELAREVAKGEREEVEGLRQNKVSTARSSSALVISSQDGQRQKIYAQIPPTAANGMSSQAFNTHFAHTVRTTETQGCDSCHVSEDEDNNAWLAQTYLLGTGFVNFVGYHAFVGAGDGGIEAVRVTEWDEPQAVIGSYLHRLAYPDRFREFVEGGRELETSIHHGGSSIQSVARRGEYLFCAAGPDGLEVYDIANIANKGFSEKIVTAPVSPIGQDTFVATEDARAVALPTNNPISMDRRWRPGNREQGYPAPDGGTQNLHELYRYAYVADAEEGLILVDAQPLNDGDPANNFLEREVTFAGDENGRLDGAVNLTVAGETVYVCDAAGVHAVSVEDPREPRVIAHVPLEGARSIAVQFRYAFVCDAEGLKVLDVTVPERMELVEGAGVPIEDARDVYLARTFAYVAAGAEGLVIVEVQRPRSPELFLRWNADGKIDDLHQVRVGMTNDTVFAYLADGRNGLRIAQLISPADADETQRSAYGFSPDPYPRLIATYPTSEPAVAVARGLDRDRAVDESGNQVAVFGRIGGRPLDLEEMRQLYLREDGSVYRVSESPPGPSAGAGSER